MMIVYLLELIGSKTKYATKLVRVFGMFLFIPYVHCFPYQSALSDF